MNAIVQRAIVGTARSGPQEPLDHPAASIVDARNELSPERRLLLSAGAMLVHDRAGFVPDSAPEVPAPSPEETRRICSPAASAVVAELLDRSLNAYELLIGSLTAIHDANYVLPPALLPRVLDHSNRRDVRSAVRGVIGERGRWLAQFNEGWQWARHHVDSAETVDRLPDDAETVWLEGDLNSRAELLKLARKLDRGKAREWLSGVWNVEKADARTRLLEAFCVALDADDIPFLEQTQKDRSAGVRSEAQEALATIDGSDLARRMRERAKEMVRIESGPPGIGSILRAPVAGKESGTRMEITLPATLPKEWIPDGIEAKPPTGTGERAWWFLQVVSRVKPQFWEEISGVSPMQILEASAHIEDAALFHEAIAKAATLFHAEDWMRAIWDFAWQRGEQKPNESPPDFLDDILAVMPPVDAEPRLMKILAAGAYSDAADLNAALGAVSGIWSEEFSRVFLNWLWKNYGSTSTQSYPSANWRNGAIAAAVRLHCACFDDALRSPHSRDEKSGYDYWHELLESFQDSIRLRKRLYEAL